MTPTPDLLFGTRIPRHAQRLGRRLLLTQGVPYLPGSSQTRSYAYSPQIEPIHPPPRQSSSTASGEDCCWQKMCRTGRSRRKTVFVLTHYKSNQSTHTPSGAAVQPNHAYVQQCSCAAAPAFIAPLLAGGRCAYIPTPSTVPMFTHALGCVCGPPETQPTYPTKLPTSPAV